MSEGVGVVEEEREESWPECVQDVVLPQWLQECLPSVPENHIMSWDEKNQVAYLRTPAGEVIYTADSIEKVYDYAEAHLERSSYTFDETVPREARTVPTEHPRRVRMLITSTHQDHLNLLKTDYQYWIEECYPEWQAHQESWFHAYSMLERHPAFWLMQHDDREEGKSLHWSTSAGLADIWVGVGGTPEEPCVALESGQHVAPEYKHCYHDLRLDVYAKSFEEAYVKLAKLVDKFFAPDGSERENVEYEKSELQLTLEARVAEARAEGLMPEEEAE